MVSSKSQLAAIVAAFIEEHGLSASEGRIITFAAEGVPRAELGERLGVSENTVKSQIMALLRCCPGTEDLVDVVQRVLARAAGR